MNLVQRLIARMCNIPLVEPTVRVQTRESWKLRLEEWRKAESLVSESIKLASNQTYKAQMDVLKVEHPCHSVFAIVGISPNDRIVHQAKCEGYELCLNNLEAMARPFKKQETLRETFEPPEENRSRRK